MKKSLKCIVSALLLGLGGLQGWAQSDTLIVSKESVTQGETDMDRLYKLFVEDKSKEVSHLWKLNLVDLGVLQPNIGFEQKLLKSITSETYLGIGKLGWYGLEGFCFNGEFEQQFKYYYNLRSREQKGKRINGFSGNYISFSGFTKYDISNSNRSELIQGQYTNAFKVSTFQYGAILKYGIQRRIGNIGYLDVHAGVKFYGIKETPLVELQNESYYPYSGWAWMPFISLRAGFAIDSFKSLRYMLK